MRSVICSSMNEPLTPQEKKTLLVVHDFWKREKRAPSIAEVAKVLGLKRAGAQRHMSTLRLKGRLAAQMRQTQHKLVPVGGWELTALGKKDVSKA